MNRFSSRGSTIDRKGHMLCFIFICNVDSCLPEETVEDDEICDDQDCRDQNEQCNDPSLYPVQCT